MDELRDFLLQEPYSLSKDEKESILCRFMKAGLAFNERNQYLASMYEKLKFSADGLRNLADIPVVPAAMFKEFDLATVPASEIAVRLRSSGTTGQTPSVVPLSKRSARNQAIALNSTLRHYLGKKRCPMMVFDVEESGKVEAASLGARGAGIRGFMQFASEIEYVLEKVGMEAELAHGRLRAFAERHGAGPAFMFGFTFQIWKVISAEKSGCRMSLPNLKIFHGGGWKKLKEMQVSREEFNAEAARFFGCPPEHIYEFYGMVEQTGLIFVDCEYGFKHVPVYGDVIVRDMYSMQPLEGVEGFINVLSVIADSYPCQSILTEDKGVIEGVDDCRCGRKGRYFRFTGRAESAELRGCGDTMGAVRS